VDWQHFVANESALRESVMAQDPSQLTFANSNHEYTIPTITGDVEVWNKMKRRWEKGSFCITRSGYLLGFKDSLHELEDNMNPKWAFNLRKTTFRAIGTSRNDSMFTLLRAKYTSESRPQESNGFLKLAQKTMSKFKTEKFIVSIEKAQEWHNAIAQFAQQGESNERQRNNSKREFNRSSTIPTRSFRDTATLASSNAADEEETVDSPQSSSASISVGGGGADKSWEDDGVDNAGEREAVYHDLQNIHNPW
jgi:hypothetical protein